MSEKSDLIITALQQRIGELVSNYETQVAILRAELTTVLNDKESKDIAIQSYSEQIENLGA